MQYQEKLLKIFVLRSLPCRFSESRAGIAGLLPYLVKLAQLKRG
jgi:hypothetical protein